MKTVPEYKYHVQVWGGFFNNTYKDIHGEEPGDYFFDTLEERTMFIVRLKALSETLDAKGLVTNLTEGYHMERTVLHRVCEYMTIQKYTTYDMGVNYPYDAAQYHLQYKWYPGCNDYPFGEEFDYQNNKINVIQEWITGAFNSIEI